ncbi:O-antigen ligase family protein [Aliarcobacter cryaerophilus]
MTFSLILLYLVKSRASFYAFFVIYLIFLLKELGFKNFFYLIIFSSLFCYVLIILDLVKVNTRMFGIYNMIKDGSFNERLEQFKYGLEAIKSNWFFGQYGGQVIYHEGSMYESGLGSYMHNFLSFWRQFGILFFITFTIFYFSRLLKVFKLWIYGHKNSDYVFYIGLYMAIGILLFHSYSYPYIWFAMTLMHLYSINNSKNV